jgi:hypothetical protein
MKKDANRRSDRLAKSPSTATSSADIDSSKSPSKAKESPTAETKSAKTRSLKPSATLVTVVKSGRRQQAPVTPSESVYAAGDSSSSDDDADSASSEEEHGWRSQPVPLGTKGLRPGKIAPAVYVPSSEDEEALPITKITKAGHSSRASHRSVTPKGKSGDRCRPRNVTPPPEQSAGEESEESEHDKKDGEPSDGDESIVLSSRGRRSPSPRSDGEESLDDETKDFERQTSQFRDHSYRSNKSAPPKRRLRKGPPTSDPAPIEHMASGSDSSGSDSDSKPSSNTHAVVREATPYGVQPKKRMSKSKSTLSDDDSEENAFASLVDTLASTQLPPARGPGKRDKTTGSAQHPPVRRGSTTPEKSGKRRRAINSSPSDQTSKMKTSPLKRVKSSPTKEPVRTMQRAQASPASTRTLYVLGTTKRPLFTSLLGFDADLLAYNLLMWDTVDRGQFMHGMKADSFEIANLPAATSSRYGSQHIVDGNVTFSKPSKHNIIDLDTPLSLNIKPLNYLGGNGKPYLAFFKVHTADIDDRPNNKAPNVRLVVYADGLIADAISWASTEDVTYLKSKVTPCYDPTAASVYALTQVSNMPSRHAGYHELKLVGPAMYGDRSYFKNRFPKLFKEFTARRASHGGEIQDTTFPKITAFKAMADTQFQTSDKPTYVSGVTIVIQSTGSELTIPLCPVQDCGLMCGYPCETGPFTCADHGEVDPMVVSRPTATALIRVQDNRSVHTDRDYPLSFTVASGQEETYLNMTLEELHEDFDVDKVRSQLVGQLFLCTLCISKSNVTATQLRRPDRAIRSVSTA